MGAIVNNPVNQFEEKTLLSEFVDDIGATDGILPLSVFLNPVGGDDETALLENADKPFQTMAALIAALPPYNGEYYNIYITGGTIPITTPMPLRNLNFIANYNTTLDFTNTASWILLQHINGQATWHFEGENIGILSTANKQLAAYTTTIVPLNMTGTLRKFDINNFYWVGPATDLVINTMVDQPTGTTGQLRYTTGSDNIKIRIKELRLSNNSNVVSGSGSTGKAKLTIDSLVKVNAGSSNLSLGGQTWQIEIGNVNYSGTISFIADKLTFFGTIQNNATINVTTCKVVSGKVITTNPITIGYLSIPIVFDEFTGKIGSFGTSTAQPITFINSNVSVEGYIENTTAVGTRDYRFQGYNTFNSLSGHDFLFNFPNGTINLTIGGTVKGNFKAFAQKTNVNDTFATFKEKLGEQVIRHAVDLVNKTLDVSKGYIVDGTITLTGGQYIEVPEDGNLTINGYGLENSKIVKDVAGESIFKSPVAGSGGLQMDSIKLSTPQSGVFDLKDKTGFNSVELVKVNFENCASLGEVDGYRQMLWENIGMFSCADGLTFSGTMIGGFKGNTIICRSFGAAGTIFKKGTALDIKNRFATDINFDLPVGANLCDFEPANFSNAKTFQLKGAIGTRAGVIDKTQNYCPNITANDSVSEWENNTGIPNSLLEPYGFKDTNLPTYADDTAAGAGGLAVGDFYIETASGYLKKRIA